jgi:hypothetical protein
MLRVALLGWLSCVACSADADTSAEQHVFTDAAGRSCEATLEKSSPSAPSLSQSVRCDGDARQCSPEASACFQLTIDDMTHQIHDCPACCRGTATSYREADCSALVCELDADCVFARAQCSGGACVCPSGGCE